MEKYFIGIIMLYGVVVACYLVWERSVRRRKNAARKKGYNPFKSSPKEDIVGKSKFTMRHSKPEATTLEMSEKANKNHSIFANENGQANVENPPVDVPPAEEKQVETSGQTVDNSGEEIDIVIENEPEGELETEDEDLDTWETEAAEDETASSRATGIGFDDLAGVVQTVGNTESATAEEREEAGRVLVEIRKTEMFGQIVSDEPEKKEIVSNLMDDYFAAYRRKEAYPEPTVKAPTGFNPRGFA
jgi:hypothetical protein